MRISILTVAIAFFFTTLSAQDIINFKPLVSVGEVPTDINTLASKKVEEQNKTIKRNQSYNDINIEKKFILESNYLLAEMLSSGMVLYGGKLNEYVESVADELLKEDAELRGELKFYILKSPMVNAFSSDRGEIFITVGLLAQIENEAQLAFVIAHELIHYVSNHAKSSFLENQKIDHQQGRYSQINWDKALRKSKYSKDLELEADIEGLKIYLNSNYKISEITSTLNVLQYSHLPFDEVKFDRHFFNDEYLTLPTSTEREVDEVEAIDDEDDQYQDHPNINKRRAVIENEVDGMSDEGKVEFIVSEKEFFEVQSLSRFELSFLYTKNRSYAEAIYNSYLLLKLHPDNKFLKINIGYSLYALAKYKNDSKLYDVLTDYKDIQGESQNVHFLFDEMNKETFSVLAVKYLWDLKEEIPDDKFLNMIAEDAIQEMLLNSGVRKSDFTYSFKVETKETKKDSSKMNKYDKIKSKKKKSGNLYEYAFINLLKNETFLKLLKEYEKAYAEKVVNENNTEFDVVKNSKKKKALGINNVVMVTPSFRHFKAKKRNFSEDYLVGEKKEGSFISLNKSIAKKKNVDLKVISSTYFASTAEFNDMCLLSDWMEERYNHLNLEIYPYCGMYSGQLIEKYGTSYFVWSGIYSFNVGKRGLGWALLGSYGLGAVGGSIATPLLFVFAAIPLVIYAVSSANHSFYYTYLFDISNYNALLVNETYKKSVPTSGYITDSFNQISRKR